MKTVFNVLNWDFNHDRLEYYDILPYFRNAFEGEKKYQKSKKHKTREELKTWINDTARYMFWARCEYEMICHGWPVQKNDYKLDIYEQIKMNLDIITDILFKEFYEC